MPEQFNVYVRFGELRIPPLADDCLSASYTAIDWSDIPGEGNIRMYWQLSDRENSIELPSQNYSLSQENF